MSGLKTAWLVLWDKQDGRCAIASCRVPITNYPAKKELGGGVMAAHTDHDHDTGKVRGLLCGQCNRTLGIYTRHINPDWQAAADVYLALANNN